MESYTTQSYWENYYQNSSVEQNTIKSICSKYDLFWELLIKSCEYSPKNIIEIGAFPGRYIAYLASKYNLEPFGLDFNPDKEKINASMRAMGVSKYTYYQGDFFQFIPPQQFDLVISNGFIEHFENYEEVLDRHCEYLNNGGAMLIMIPNKRYFRKWYGQICDKDNLRKHNLKCMNLKTFENFAQKNNLKIEYLSYHGGFAYKVHQPLNIFQRIIYKFVRYLSLKLNSKLSEYPSKWWSSSIIAVFSKY